MSKSKKETEDLLHDLPGYTKADKLKTLWEGSPATFERSEMKGWYGCQRCDLCKTRPTEDIVFCSGNPESSVMIIGEAPGEDEERYGSPFIGASGRLLNQMLCQLSDDSGMQELWKWWSKAPHTVVNSTEFHKRVFEWREKNFFFTNVVACRPIDNAAPAKPYIKACWERLLNTIYTVDPIMIISSGATAASVLVNRPFEITKNRGQIHDIYIPGRVGKPLTYTMMPTLHPSYLLRKADFSDPKGDYSKTVKDFYSAFRIVDHLKEQYYGIPVPVRMEP